MKSTICILLVVIFLGGCGGGLSGPSDDTVKKQIQDLFSNGTVGGTDSIKKYCQLEKIEVLDRKIERDSATIKVRLYLTMLKDYAGTSIMESLLRPYVGQGQSKKGEKRTFEQVFHFEKWESGWRLRGR